MQSHPTITFEERSTLCRCLNYKKLSFEASKDLAKNPRIPPRIAMQALISQQSKISTKDLAFDESQSTKPSQIVVYNEADRDVLCEEKEDMRLNLERMQWRVVELEKLCREMKGQMSSLVSHNAFIHPSRIRAISRFCWMSICLCIYHCSRYTNLSWIVKYVILIFFWILVFYDFYVMEGKKKIEESSSPLKHLNFLWDKIFVCVFFLIKYLFLIFFFCKTSALKKKESTDISFKINLYFYSK